MTARRSPYLILGVPYGASKAEASRAFARATRRLRRSEDSPFDLEDLNWALHQIEQRVDDPALSIDDFRLPADPSVYEIPSGPGILNPPMSVYPRTTDPTDPSVIERLRADTVTEIAQTVIEDIRRRMLPQLHSFTPKGP